MDRLTTGIKNLDDVLGGGFPRASINILAGAPGTGKTMLAHEVAYLTASPTSKVLYITTVSEPMHKVLLYVQDFPFFDPDKVETSIRYEDIGGMLQKAPLIEVMSAIADMVDRESPAMLIIDSFKALGDFAPDTATFRRALYDLTGRLTASGCTTFLLGEYGPDDMQRHPEFGVADGIIEMSNERRGIRTYRYLSIAKLRGSGYQDGRHAVRLTGDGIQIFPRFRTPKNPVPYTPGVARASMGAPGVDEILGGGVIPGSATLAMGATGTGKTLLALGFALEAAKRGERAVFVSFQEDPSQLREIARKFGWALEKAEASGHLRLLYVSPVELDLDEHMLKIVDAIETSGAGSVVIDSVSDLEASAYDQERFASYMYSLIQYGKDRKLTLFMTMEHNEVQQLSGWTQTNVSRMADNVIYLGNVRQGKRMQREMRIIKTRGTAHDHDVHDVDISARGFIVTTAARK